MRVLLDTNIIGGAMQGASNLDGEVTVALRSPDGRMGWTVILRRDPACRDELRKHGRREASRAESA